MTHRIPDVLIHKTPADRLPKIMRDGLRVNQLRTSIGYTPRIAVYLALSADILEDDCHMGPAYADMVTLYVDVSEFKAELYPDPEWRSEDNHNPEHFDDDMAWYVLHDIPPHLISLTAPEGYVVLDPFRP